MSQVGNISRTASGDGVANLVQENFAAGVVPHINHLSPVAGLFENLDSGRYTLTGKELVIFTEQDPMLNFMGTDGYLPDAQEIDGARLKTTPARLYSRGAIDHFVEALTQANAFEDQFSRVQRQIMEGIERKTTFHIHGSSAATVATFVSRTNATTIVVDAGYGVAGAPSGLFIERGAVLALLDANDSYSVIGVARVQSKQDNTPSAGQTTVVFESDIDTSSEGADGDPLVFATSTSTSATNFVTERNRAPLGLVDIMDPFNANTTHLNLSETTYPRWEPTRITSSDFGFNEIMSLQYRIAARSQMPVNEGTHVLTLHPGLEIELAKELLQYQQQSNLGMELVGGWQTVKIGQWSVLSDPYHLPTVAYMHCLEDLYVVPLNQEMLGYIDEDGSQFQRILDYDGREWALRSYLQRFADRRIRHGMIVGASNPSYQLYSATAS